MGSQGSPASPRDLTSVTFLLKVVLSWGSSSPPFLLWKLWLQKALAWEKEGRLKDCSTASNSNLPRASSLPGNPCLCCLVQGLISNPVLPGDLGNVAQRPCPWCHLCPAMAVSTKGKSPARAHQNAVIKGPQHNVNPAGFKIYMPSDLSKESPTSGVALAQCPLLLQLPQSPQ